MTPINILFTNYRCIHHRDMSGKLLKCPVKEHNKYALINNDTLIKGLSLEYVWGG